MNRYYAQITCGIGLVLGLGASVEAQPQPVSTTGGYASRQLRSIYNQGVGNNYTADSIARQRLSRDNLMSLQNVGRVGRSSLGGSSSGLVTPSSKPFSSYSPLPTVSPYLNLFRDDFDGSDDFNYQTLVRPQIQQREFNDRVQRELYQTSRRLQTIAAQSDYNIQGSTAMPATGHPTAFMNHGRYYPMPSARRR